MRYCLIEQKKKKKITRLIIKTTQLVRYTICSLLGLYSFSLPPPPLVLSLNFIFEYRVFSHVRIRFMLNAQRILIIIYRSVGMQIIWNCFSTHRIEIVINLHGQNKNPAFIHSILLPLSACHGKNANFANHKPTYETLCMCWNVAVKLIRQFISMICAPISTDNLINNGKNVSLAKLFIVCVIANCHSFIWVFSPSTYIYIELKSTSSKTISMLVKIISFRWFVYLSHSLCFSRFVFCFLLTLIAKFRFGVYRNEKCQ